MLASVDLLLHPEKVIVIVPAPWLPVEESREPGGRTPALSRWVRGVLLVIALGLVTVFGIALWLDPYDENGRPRRLETHLQLGLPPCTFRILTGVPCPSCGMTTSFAFLIRGDLGNSLRANAVGTLLAAVCLAFIPWSLVCVLGKRFFFIASTERVLLGGVLIFVVLLLLRWLIVLGWAWWGGTSF
jgi:hypothetical protein